MKLLSAVGPYDSLQQLLPSPPPLVLPRPTDYREICVMPVCLSLLTLGLTLFLLDINIAPLVNASCAEGEKNLQDAMDVVFLRILRIIPDT